MANEHHIVGSRIPTIVEYIAKGQPIADTDLEHLAVVVIFGGRTATFQLTTFLVYVLFRFGNQVKGHWQTNALTMIQGGQKVDAFDIAPLRVVKVPANDLVLVGVGLLFDAIIKD